MAFTKIHTALITSTVWQEPYPHKIAWVTMMVLADQHGEVFASIPGLAKQCGIKVDEMEAALQSFMEPDKYSRTKDFEGRRIEEIDGGWALLNHPKYRKMASKEDAKERATERTGRWRKRVKEGLVSTPCDAMSTVPRDIAEADADVEANADAKSKPESSSTTPLLAVETTTPVLVESGVKKPSVHPMHQIPAGFE